MSIPNLAKAIEVSPRGGLQNERSLASVDTKVELVNRLSEAGFVNVEAASFVPPEWVSTMVDSTDVMACIRRRSDALYSALTFNMKGFEGAATAGADEIVIFNAASEAFAQKNINCTIAGSIECFVPVAKAVKDAGIRVYGSISCSLSCPYQDEVPVSLVVDVIKRMADLGHDEINTADTVGVSTARWVKTVMEAIVATSLIDHLPGHSHDTYGQVLTNTLADLEVGIAIFHASVARLGGCPYAKGTAGNVVTEDVLYLLHGSGIRTGIDLDKVVLADDPVLQAIDRPTASRAGRAPLFKLQDQITQAYT